MFLMCPSKSIKAIKATNANKARSSLTYMSSGARKAARQSGSMIVMALFAIIVLALLAGTLVNMLSTSSNSVLFEVYGVRAKNAAQAGIQELAMTAFPLGAGPQLCNQVIVNPATFASIPGFQSCQFTARCTTSDINFNGEDYRYYRFSSTGSCGFDGVVVSRTVSVDAMQEN
ncbi:type II secretory pathway component [Glaciecola nitratireducens FR1064]|uniref:Type II secretory pathway component n=2 Tax=Brumicola TaxID=3160924 RepID=G4QFF6_GLANF|nr:type II secretory pathway component [Glaciecola nitratireducens FR1064]